MQHRLYSEQLCSQPGNNKTAVSKLWPKTCCALVKSCTAMCMEQAQAKTWMSKSFQFHHFIVISPWVTCFCDFLYLHVCDFTMDLSLGSTATNQRANFILGNRKKLQATKPGKYSMLHDPLQLRNLCIQSKSHFMSFVLHVLLPRPQNITVVLTPNNLTLRDEFTVHYKCQRKNENFTHLLESWRLQGLPLCCGKHNSLHIGEWRNKLNGPHQPTILKKKFLLKTHLHTFYEDYSYSHLSPDMFERNKW